VLFELNDIMLSRLHFPIVNFERANELCYEYATFISFFLVFYCEERAFWDELKEETGHLQCLK